MNQTTVDQWTPIFNAAMSGALKITGGFLQRKWDRSISNAVTQQTRQTLAEQRVANRLALSAARVNRASSGSDVANLDLVFRDAAAAERALVRIRQQGAYLSAYYDRQGDYAATSGLGSSLLDISEGFAESLARGLFAKDTGPSPTISIAPAPASHASPGTAAYDFERIA